LRWNAVAVWRCWLYEAPGMRLAEVANLRAMVGVRFAGRARIGQPAAANDVLPWGFR